MELTRCGSCWKPTPSDKLTRCVWDDRLMVCPSCEVVEENRCPDCGSDALRYAELGEDIHKYAATCEDCGFHTQDGEGDLLRVKIGPVVEKKPVTMEFNFHAKLAEALRSTGTDDEEEVF